MLPLNRTIRSRIPGVSLLAAGVVAVGALSACSQSDTAERQPLGTSAEASSSAGADGEESGPKLPLAAMTALDAGNTAYRAKQFDAAIVRYREAAAAAPDHAAPWFGLYMAANEVKNTALADSAMRRVKALSADPATLNAHVEVASPTVIPSTPSMPPNHPSGAAPTPLPSGHPSATPLPPGHPAPAGPATPVVPRKSAESAKRGRA
jgi:hypothetical protein